MTATVMGRLAGRARAGARSLLTPEPRRPLPAWSAAADAVLATVATVAVLAEVLARPGAPAGSLPAGTSVRPATVAAGGARRAIGYAAFQHGHLVGIFARLPHIAPAGPGGPPLTAVSLAALALTAAPLAVRRRYPIASCLVIAAAILLTRAAAPPLTFITGVFAAYSTVVYSRYRQLAVLTVAAASVIVTITFPNTVNRLPERFTGMLVVVPVVVLGIGMRQWRQRAGDSADRLRRAQAEHEAATRRAVELERARIAGELHDMVTHNVSVMVVQAGASRRMLDISPGAAREALLAVEASGRTAMAELRQLLGLLSPSDQEAGPVALNPQPGLAQLPALLHRVAAAGLPVELAEAGTPRGLPPGLDLAAYRVVQESLTNVIKHAGQAPARVLLDYGDEELVVEVADAGAGGAAAPPADGKGAGRGLVGLRERVALYGGGLDAGPRPGGGWAVRAVIPFSQRTADPADRPAALAGVRPAAS